MIITMTLRPIRTDSPGTVPLSDSEVSDRLAKLLLFATLAALLWLSAALLYSTTHPSLGSVFI
jgi:hypothetical protein